MIAILYGIVLAGVLVFVMGTIARAAGYAGQPIHLRWELYPVPHEDPHRARYGGSRYEEVDAWTKPRRFNLAGEVGFMVPEMLFLKGLREFNRALWRRSFPFHFGLYLLTGTVGLVVATLFLERLAPTFAAGPVGTAFHWLYTVTGLTGLVLAIVGAGALLHRRLTDENLRPYTVPGDLLNLVWFIAALGCLLLGFLLRGPDAPSTVAIAWAIVTVNGDVAVPPLLAIGLVLSALLVAYIPFTHMAHFVAKYFTYHTVRWDDRAGGRIERKVAEYLTSRPTWAAPHVGADGKKSWGEIASTNPAEGEKKP